MRLGRQRICISRRIVTGTGGQRGVQSPCQPCSACQERSRVPDGQRSELPGGSAAVQQRLVCLLLKASQCAPNLRNDVCVSSCGPQCPCRCNANAFCRGRRFTADGCCFCRFLFILGHLLRYGIETIEAADQPPDRAVTAEACLDVFLSFFKAPTQAHGKALGLLWYSRCLSASA